jgi:glucose/arabinose dehydrogenase
VLSPEYRGDGGKAVGICAHKLAPLASFPAHWAPNDLVICTGTSFPGHYHNGAFIAFHGSWDRAPYPQGGYNVVFQPLAGNAAAGSLRDFRRRLRRTHQGARWCGASADRRGSRPRWRALRGG